MQPYYFDFDPFDFLSFFNGRIAGRELYEAAVHKN